MARQMKDSGIAWIGEIPEGWGVYRAKYLFQTGDGALRIGPFGSALSGKSLAEGPYKIYNQAHLVSNDFSLCRHFVSEETYKDLQSYEVAPGDILFSMMGTIGKCRVMPAGQQRGIMDSHLLKARLNDLISPRFFEYVYDKDLSPVGIGQLSFFSNGSIMAGLNSSIVSNVYFPLPSVEEQHRITAYLDRRCAEIDAVMERTKATIEEYKKLKQAVITEAVTKGVRGPRKMKDSGIEWIGEIPEGWSIRKLFRVIDAIGDIDHYMPESVTSGIPYLMTGDLRENISQVRFEQCKQVSFEDFLALSKKIKATMGDVIFARYATIGTVCYVDSEKDFLVSYSCLTIKPTPDLLLGKFLFYYLKSTPFYEEVRQYINSNTQANVGLDSMTKAKVTLPPVCEQEEIIAYLDEKCAALDAIIARKTALLTELETYKKSLIYEYVTGKKEVET